MDVQGPIEEKRGNWSAAHTMGILSILAAVFVAIIFLFLRYDSAGEALATFLLVAGITVGFLTGYAVARMRK